MPALPLWKTVPVSMCALKQAKPNLANQVGTRTALAMELENL